jgi:Zn-dependent protease
MIFKTKICHIEIEIVLIFVVLTSIISKTLFKFLYYFFACYLFILFHELMHILIGIVLNKKLIKIKFSLSGVCAIFEKEKYIRSRLIYVKNILIYISGPISNLILAYLFIDNAMIRNINIFLAILNLLPIFPLDGYNIFLNIFNIMFIVKKSIRIMNNITNACIILILLVALYQIKEYHNFSMIIFCIYLFVLKLNKKNE